MPEPMPAGGWVWVPPAGWPTPPAGWTPPPGWTPDPTWPAAPDDHVWWRPLHRYDVVGDRSAWPTMLVTLVLTPFIGWIPALVQSRSAARRGSDPSFYWKAYAAAVVTSLVVGLALRGLRYF